MKFGTARRADPLLDVTPMIDVVFQLVLFFMVSTTFTEAPGIQVDLPKASAQVVISEGEELNIWLSTDGELFLNQDPTDLRQLKSALLSAAKRDPSTVVVIKADQGVTHGRVVTVMDIARTQGLNRLAIATETPDG